MKAFSGVLGGGGGPLKRLFTFRNVSTSDVLRAFSVISADKMQPCINKRSTLHVAVLMVRLHVLLSVVRVLQA